MSTDSIRNYLKKREAELSRQFFDRYMLMSKAVDKQPFVTLINDTISRLSEIGDAIAEL